ncbi:hypothetical protein HY947_00460 [Candidatus Gottesmanbacteria bacterium]|nr:hypothetical protein [Candidatus Gottesmanbacteria bacterium]
MTSTAHTLVGGAIASAIPNPYLAIPLILASHFLMDSIPHWDMGTNWRNRSKRETGALAITETLMGITIAYSLYQGKVETSFLVLAIIASILPDWLETPWYIFYANQKKHEPGKNASFFEKLCFFVYKIENMFHSKAQFPLGVFTQIATVAFFLIVLHS